ncbi:MAG: hypothetical protein NTV09_03940, partial [Bacteroidetes bacterium]|nr:hypothetical protein [Bacteroidota bacterium]
SDNSKDGYLYSEMNYDSRGNLIEYKEYKRNGAIKIHGCYTMDDSGRMLEYRTLRPDGSNKYRESYTYDAAGNQTDLRNFGRTSLFSRKEKIWFHSAAKFDDKQNMLEQNYYYDANDKKLFDRFVYSYYDDGSKKQTVEYNRKGKVRHSWKYDCNPVGKMEAKNLKDTSKICIRYETDAGGNKIKVKEENVKRGKVVRVIHKYDKNENQVEEISYDAKGRLRFHSTSGYDEKDNCTSFTAYRLNSNKIKIRYLFNYDSSGNITERIAYKESSVPAGILKFNYSK